jgi:hypothetical protein
MSLFSKLFGSKPLITIRDYENLQKDYALQRQNLNIAEASLKETLRLYKDLQARHDIFAAENKFLKHEREVQEAEAFKTQTGTASDSLSLEAIWSRISTLEAVVNALKQSMDGANPNLLVASASESETSSKKGGPSPEYFKSDAWKKIQEDRAAKKASGVKRAYNKKQNYPEVTHSAPLTGVPVQEQIAELPILTHPIVNAPTYKSPTPETWREKFDAAAKKIEDERRGAYLRSMSTQKKD